MNEYIITRRDSLADGGSRLPALTMGVIFAACHRAAMSEAHRIISCSDYQWLELDNVKYAKRARVNAARRVAVYNSPDAEVTNEA